MVLFCSKKAIANVKEYNIKSNGDFYCLNCLHSFKPKYKLLIKKVCENKDFFDLVMPFEDTKILEFNKYPKSANIAFVIHADLESMIEKTDGYKNNPEKLSITKVVEHILSDFPMSAILSLKNIWDMHDVYIVEVTWKTFCKFLRERTMKIIIF